MLFFHKASVVAQTRIEYNRQELNQLIYQDLMKQGLGKTASMLLNEAKLPEPTCATPVPSKITPASILTPSSSHRNTGGTPCWVKNTTCFYVSFLSVDFLVETTPFISYFVENVNSSAINIFGLQGRRTNHSVQTLQSFIQVETKEKASGKNHILLTYRKEPVSSFENVDVKEFVPERTLEPPNLTLDGIITEYLKNQHALCKNPVATCPRFDLFK